MESIGQPFWESFRLDPRLSTNAHLRASDADREIVHALFDDAYADGRLDREEYDARVTALIGTRTLGELPALVSDLVASDPPTSSVPALVPSTELQVRAQAAYRREVREAIGGFLVPSLITVVIWLLTGAGFFWPGFVLLFTGINVVQTVVRRDAIMERESKRIVKKAQRERQDSEDQR